MQENGSKPSSLHRVFFFLAAVHKRLFYRCAAGAAGLRSLGIGEAFLNKQDGFVIQRHCLQICECLFLERQTKQFTRLPKCSIIQTLRIRIGGRI